MRRTVDGRLLAGGEDEGFQDADRRDAPTPEKAKTLARKVTAWTGSQLSVDCAWAATFGASEGGLPGIGASNTSPEVYLAMAYGGNGVAYAALAVEILERRLTGVTAAADDYFAPYRFGPP